MNPRIKAILVLVPLQAAIVITLCTHRIGALQVMLIVAAWVTTKLEVDNTNKKN